MGRPRHFGGHARYAPPVRDIGSVFMYYFSPLIVIEAVAMEREVEGDTVLHDMGHGLPFRPATFDAAIRPASHCLSLFASHIQTVCFYSERNLSGVQHIGAAVAVPRVQDGAQSAAEVDGVLPVALQLPRPRRPRRPPVLSRGTRKYHGNT